MDDTLKIENLGDLVISESVIAGIAINTAKDIEGLASFSVYPANFLAKLKPGDEPLKYVKVYDGENRIKIEIFVNIKSGYKITAVANEIQQKVKTAVESITGQKVKSVNVTVAGIEDSQMNNG